MEARKEMSIPKPKGSECIHQQTAIGPGQAQTYKGFCREFTSLITIGQTGGDQTTKLMIDLNKM